MGGCMSRASMGCFVDPVVTFKSCKVSGVSFRGPTLDTTLNVQNLNPASLEATEISYKICKESDGTLLADGTIERNYKIPGMDSKDVVVPTTFTYGGLGAAGMSLIRSGKTKLVLSGGITFVAPLTKEGKVTIPFKGEALVQLQEPVELHPPANARVT